MSAISERGHRSIPHTADATFEAWGPSIEQCLEEAVVAFVESFAEIPENRPATDTAMTSFQLRSDISAELLLELLEEVIYVVEVKGMVPVNVQIEPGLRVIMHTIPVEEVMEVGAIPKAITRHDLKIEPAWRCQFTIDV